MGQLMSMDISYAKRFPDSYYRDDARWAYVIMFDPASVPVNSSGRQRLGGRYYLPGKDPASLDHLWRYCKT
jgi:hypothetical protein